MPIGGSHNSELGPAALMSSDEAHWEDSWAQLASFFRKPPLRARPPRQCTRGAFFSHGQTNAESARSSHCDRIAFSGHAQKLGSGMGTSKWSGLWLKLKVKGSMSRHGHRAFSTWLLSITLSTKSTSSMSRCFFNSSSRTSKYTPSRLPNPAPRWVAYKRPLAMVTRTQPSLVVRVNWFRCTRHDSASSTSLRLIPPRKRHGSRSLLMAANKFTPSQLSRVQADEKGETRRSHEKMHHQIVL
mmetsp:Transcript_29020/g.59348  ORF Transcript_29020/g.59348 Transcript_29020/m.59348 type:complete len:242 (+) Transcript_29020:319-1044(+)